MTHSSVGPDGLSGGALYAMAGGAAIFTAEMAAVASAVASTLPSGAAALVGITDVALIVTSICDPFSFFSEADRWQQVALLSESWTKGIPPVMSKFDDAWEGASADAFVSFFTSTLDPVFPLFQSLATSERDLLLAAGKIIIGAIISVTVPTAALTVIALSLLGMAPATFGASIAAQWPATGSWAVIIGGAVTALVAMFMELTKALDSVKIAGTGLSAHVNGATGRLENNRMAPPELALPPIGSDITTLAQMNGKFTPA